MDTDRSREEVYPIDRGWAWVVLFACFFEQLLLIGTHASFGILFNEFKTAYSSSATIISVALSVQTIVLSLLSLFILSIGSRYLSNRVFVMMGGLTSFAAYMLNAFLPDISYLILSQGILFGLTHAFAQGPSLVILGKYFKKYRGLATTLANVGASSGIFIFPLVLRKLIDNYGLQGALIIHSGLLLNFLVAGGLLRPLSFYDKPFNKHLARYEKAEESEELLQDQKPESVNGNVSEDQISGQPNSKTIDKSEITKGTNQNCQKYPIDYLQTQSISNSLESCTRKRTYSDSQKERPKIRKITNDHLKPEMFHSTRSLNKVLDRVGISGDMAIASSVGDISGSVYSVCGSKSEVNVLPEDQNTNSVGESQDKKKRVLTFLKELIGLKCLKIRIFQIWLIVAFCGILGTAQIITYIPPLAEEKGIDKSQRVLLLTFVGAADLAGKFFLAILTFLNLFPKEVMMAVALWILAVVFSCVAFFTEFSHFVVLSCVVGSCTGVYFALFPAVMADLVGLENLSGAMGLTMLVHGFSLTVGNPILGAIKDLTGSFIGSFLYTGGCTFLSAIAMTICYFYGKKIKRYPQNCHDVIEIVADEPEQSMTLN